MHEFTYFLNKTKKFAPCFFSNKYWHKRMCACEELGILLFIHLLYFSLKPCLEKEMVTDPEFIFSLSDVSLAIEACVLFLNYSISLCDTYFCNF